MEKAYSQSPQQCLEFFKVTTEEGLSTKEVEAQRLKYGFNELPKEEGTPLWKLILKQFEDILVRILVLSAFISFVLALLEEHVTMSSFIEPFVIVLILFINATVGVLQEGNAEKAIEALKEYEAPHAKVIRNGRLEEIAARELVPGDVVQVAVGDITPADLRIIKMNSTSLKSSQSALTGESESVQKVVEKVDKIEDEKNKVMIQDKKNLLFSGCLVTYGKALCLCIATGSMTELGKINKLLKSGRGSENKEGGGEKKTEADEEKDRTPLQKNLDDFGEKLSIVILIICVVVWVTNWKHFFDPSHGSFIRGAIYYFKIAVALGVAAIPEGLPTVITLTFSVGTMKMAKKNAIMRNLPAVETLGATSVICTDKTGTLTTNKMSAVKMLTVEDEKAEKFNDFDVKDSGFDPSIAEVKLGGKIVKNPYETTAVEWIARVCSMSNDCNLGLKKNDEIEVIGEPTEAALRVLVEKILVPNHEKDTEKVGRAEKLMFCNKYWEKKHEGKKMMLEFTRERKSMSCLANNNVLFVKGAYECVIERCSRVMLNDGKVIEMTKELKNKIIEYIRQNYSIKLALRCLGMAYKENVKLDKEKVLQEGSSTFAAIESDMTFCGVAGIIDPPREQVYGAVETCRKAGIRVIMITGDNKNTAEAIGKNIGLFKDLDLSDKPVDYLGKNGYSFEGQEFSNFSSDEKVKAVKTARIFARVEPEHKLRIVECLQNLGEVAAMTGDGVNDSPALKRANIGIAMGSGTSVAKGASKMILQDDNFATIVAAVAEGRTIYNNTKQFIRYLISSNIGEVVSIFIGSMLGIPEHLNAIQLLFCNLVTDGLPANALGFNPADEYAMTKKPRKASEPIIDAWQFTQYMITGTYVGLSTIMGFIWWFLYYSQGPKFTYAQLTSFSKCTGPQCHWFHENSASTIALTILVVIEMFNALSDVSEQSIFTTPPTKNVYLLVAVGSSFVIHLVMVYVPPIAFVFKVAPLDLEEWIAILLLASPIILISEVLKFISRNTEK